MLSKHLDQLDKQEQLDNERRLRNQASTFSQFAQSEAAEARGRFTANEKSTVVGSTPTPASAYPAGPNWTCDPVGPEPSLGYSVEDHEPAGQPHELRASHDVRPHPELLSLLPAQATPNLAIDEAPLPPPGVEHASAGLGFSSLKMFRRA
jgi:hypothetical protein